MTKKQMNFRFDDDVVIKLDLLVKTYSNEFNIKLDRTKVIEKLIIDKYKESKQN